ncbi:MAG: hypothetical protein AAF871_16745 [Pseudomonadota bacterium]
MTAAAIEDRKMPLGVGNIISSAFSILFGNFFSVIILAFVPTLIGLVIQGALIGWSAMMGTGGPEDFASFSGVGYAISQVASLVIYGITVALMVQLAYDAKLGRPTRIGSYISPALRSAVPIAVLAFIMTILMIIGFLLLVIPGLWIYAVFSVMPAAVVIERVGFGGLRRSAQLTKEYRWPIIGAMILAFIFLMVFGVIAVFIAGGLMAVLGSLGSLGIAMTVVVLAAIYAITYGFAGILVALIYARLREIKEGVSVDQIASVFD